METALSVLFPVAMLIAVLWLLRVDRRALPPVLATAALAVTAGALVALRFIL
ncbi:hypothetical protein [Streptomyces sp. RKAG337]|uniref:hypothetical protein n=1 Tax=Streptomyces sp. RKAG337 TaxID=2893404 RepID=UPI002033FED5|nr:hypothetical protein [Streptomyces sp. RKAG337]MCM2427372.1 hypothetical protein [Streptomyces sp. RKAG337]